MRKRIFAFLLSFIVIGSVVFTTNSFVAINAQTGLLDQSVINARIIPAPPVGFDPLRASPEQLKTYGFPPKPTNEQAIAAWQDVMAHAKHYEKPEMALATNIKHYWDTQTLAGCGLQAENNKRGGTYSPQYDSVAMTWVMPTYNRGLNTGEIASYWTGTGCIANSTTITQAGADANLSYLSSLPSPLTAGTNYAFWTEEENVSPAYSQLIYYTAPLIRGGDTLYVYLVYNSYSTAYLENITTGGFAAVSFYTPYYDYYRACYLHEKVIGNYDSISPNVQFSNCYFTWHDWGGGNGDGILTNYNYTVCRMVSGGVKSQPVYIQNGGFQISGDN